MERPDAILIAGPTASGKSKFALEVAQQWGGEIVNADSMQIYPVLDVLTARPEPQDLKLLPHHLYGYAPIEAAYSVARWLQDAQTISEDLWARGAVPIFVGGTGLYFKALEEGLVAIPDIPAELRNSIRADLQEQGSIALHQRLMKEDPEGAERLRPSDGHRIARALEVILATGKSLSHLQKQTASTPVLKGKKILRYVLMPKRHILHERINLRTEIMLKEGAIKEVEMLLKLNLPDSATVLKAIGVKQITAFLAQKEDLYTVITKIQAATRQYSKRQSTWFNGQFTSDWEVVRSKE